jgi:hypothetical protein
MPKTLARPAPPVGDRDVAGSWLAAGLCLSLVVPWSEKQLERVGPWLLSSIGERLDLPPAGVIADVGALLYGERLVSHARRTVLDPRLETALRRYEDAVLGRLDASTHLAAGADAMARLSPQLRALGVGIFVTSMLTRMGYDAGTTLPPGLVRTAVRRPGREVVERGFVTLRDSAAARATLSAGYEGLVRGAQRTAQLVSDADVFALENLGVLRTLTQRLAIAQVVEAQEAIARGFQRRIRSTRASTGNTATRLEDESEYPVGGFSSISNSGTLENLVSSELVYMESPSQPRATGGEKTVDLFDMRYTEGELLYYTRDEAIFTRQRRVITLILGNDLTMTRVKDATLPWQRIVLLLGLVMATIKKLFEDLAGEALALRVVFARDVAEQPSALRAERELCELALREWRDRGVLVVEETTLAAEARLLAATSRRALVEVVVFSALGSATALDQWQAAARAAKLDPQTTCIAATTGLGQAADLEAWKESAVELVAALL